MKLFSIIFGGTGLILLAIAAFLVIREQSFLGSSESTTGTVVGLAYSRDSDNNGGSYCPVVDFTTKTEKKVEYESNVCASPPGYQVGQQVKLYYDPQDLSNVQLSGIWGQYAGSIVLILVGLPFSLIGVWTFFSSLRS
jgi:hypothetical protein